MKSAICAVAHTGRNIVFTRNPHYVDGMQDGYQRFLQPDGSGSFGKLD